MRVYDCHCEQQVFDGERATRIVNCPCDVNAFHQVELKVLSAMLAMGKRRRLSCTQVAAPAIHYPLLLVPHYPSQLDAASR